MQTHLPATTTPARIRGLRRWPIVAGLGLALALAVSIGVAQLTGPDAAQTEGTTAVSEAAPARPAQSAALGEAPAPVVYVAATREQAAHALQISGEINALRAQPGQSEVSVSVLVLETDSTLALDALPGAPGTRYVDLRTP